jgi:stalled ribosome rescue protein Dom34
MVFRLKSKKEQENVMNKNAVHAGVWIDHREAVIVIVSKQGVETKTIASHVEKQPGRLEGVRSTAPYEAQQVSAEDSHEREFTNNLERYYDHVVESIGDVESVLIIGPGEAKGEFKKRIEKHWPKEHIFAVETADKMTDRQIAAKVRECFQK